MTVASGRSVIWRSAAVGRCSLWTQRRFVCDQCQKRHMETHAQFLGGMTRRLARRRVQDAQVKPISAVSRQHRISWHLIMGLVSDWSGLIQNRRLGQRCRVLLIDETSIRKRHRYVTVVVSGDAGQVLAMLPGRSKQALSRFFVEQGPRWCQQVRTVVTDGSLSYRAAIRRYLSHTRHVPSPVPPGPMVHPRTDPGTPGTPTPPTPKCETRLRSGPVASPVRSPLRADLGPPPLRLRPVGWVGRWAGSTVWTAQYRHPLI